MEDRKGVSQTDRQESEGMQIYSHQGLGFEIQSVHVPQVQERPERHKCAEVY